MYEEIYMMGRNAIDELQRAIKRNDSVSASRNRETYEFCSTKLATMPEATYFYSLLEEYKERAKFGLSMEDSYEKYRTNIIPRLNQLCMDYARAICLGIKPEEKERFNAMFRALYVDAREVLKFQVNKESLYDAYEDVLLRKLQVENNPTMFVNGFLNQMTK